ncbi:DUF641 domain-containing protein [Cephalotus follicularis]|uniref:DUF641 domain-containing protein n=1 Tax=Cephalotus follicularis TaxID=3775 RepID=A0A1Q3BV63_CEPFO|nr:DUF641 domain-containing protein [Cephalotus follicularis]
MPDMIDNSSTTTATTKPPQISEMFQKFAIAFKTKTFEFFADGEDPSDIDGFSLLDSAEDFITDQKVVVIKPDQPPNSPNPPQEESPSNFPVIDTPIAKQQQKQKQEPTHDFSWPKNNTQMTQTLISSVFATISSFEASYLQLQTAHVPFVEESVVTADRALVSHLEKLSNFKRFFRDFCRSPDFDADLPIGSSLEAQVQENQSKLRALETFSNRLQAEIDQKDNEVVALRRKLSEIQMFISMSSKKLSGNLSSISSCDVLFTVRVFDSFLHDAFKDTRKFSKILINLMRKAGWDLDSAANSVYNDIDYAKKGHIRYAFVSYVCLGMFRGFDLEGFGVEGSEIVCNGHGMDSIKSNRSLKQLLEHASSNPMELLSSDSNCEFSKFCEKKYQELIHPTIESSIFCKFDRNEVILKSWRSLSMFYESFVNMASSIWTLHKLAFSFDPVVEIFQMERGANFAMVYMEDVTRRCMLPWKSRAKVGFTVVPGFKIGRTVIQSQVYLNGLAYTE